MFESCPWPGGGGGESGDDEAVGLVSFWEEQLITERGIIEERKVTLTSYGGAKQAWEERVRSQKK